MVSLLKNLQLSPTLLFISIRKDSSTGDSGVIRMPPLPPNDQQKLKLVFPLGNNLFMYVFIIMSVGELCEIAFTFPSTSFD